MKTLHLPTLLLALVACVDDGNIEGSGELVDVQQDVAAFHAVEVSDGLRAEIVVGPQNVALHLDDNIAHHVRVVVRGGVLVLEANENNMGFDPSAGAVIRVASPTIDAVTVRDGANATAEARGTEVTAKSYDGGKLVFDAREAQVVHATARDGSSIVLTGATTDLDVEARDGSNITSQIPSESAAVRSHDGSEIRARASKSVRVQASDGSSVHIHGNPGSRDVNTSDGSSVDFSD